MQMQKQGTIKSNVRQALWDMLKHTEYSSVEKAQSAAKLISFFAKGNARVLTDEIDNLLEAVCGTEAWCDPIVTQYAIAACQCGKGVLDGAKIREMISTVSSIASQSWCMGSEWFPVLEHIVNLVDRKSVV